VSARTGSSLNPQVSPPAGVLAETPRQPNQPSPQYNSGVEQSGLPQKQPKLPVLQSPDLVVHTIGDCNSGSHLKTMPTNPLPSESIVSAAEPTRPHSRQQHHADGPKSRQRNMTHPRKRAVTACENCRARKIKCDNLRPICSSCSKLGALCSYDQRSDHSSYAALRPP